MTPRVLIIGDVMVDRYHFGTATRISPESPIPVVKITNKQSFMGGAGNVAANLQELGAEVKLVHGWHTKEALLMLVPEKNRLMVGDYQIARWDEYDDVSPIDLEQLDRAVLHWKPDAIVISDYAKGSLNSGVIEWLRNEEAGPNIPIFIDTKCNPSIFPWASNVTFFPNTKEYAEYCGEYDRRPNVVYKLGALGIRRLKFGQIVEDYPAWATKVVAVMGAGDTVLSAFVFASITGEDPLAFANAAAAVSVSKPWTSTATVEEINEVLEKVNATVEEV